MSCVKVKKLSLLVLGVRTANLQHNYSLIMPTLSMHRSHIHLFELMSYSSIKLIVITWMTTCAIPLNFLLFHIFSICTTDQQNST